jgi:hypothetical protein
MSIENLYTVYDEDGGKKFKGKVVPVRDVKKYRGRVDVNPLILNLATTLCAVEWSASSSGRLTPRKKWPKNDLV